MLLQPFCLNIHGKKKKERNLKCPFKTCLNAETECKSKTLITVKNFKLTQYIFEAREEFKRNLGK